MKTKISPCNSVVAERELHFFFKSTAKPRIFKDKRPFLRNKTLFRIMFVSFFFTSWNNRQRETLKLRSFFHYIVHTIYFGKKTDKNQSKNVTKYHTFPLHRKRGNEKLQQNLSQWNAKNFVVPSDTIRSKNYRNYRAPSIAREAIFFCVEIYIYFFLHNFQLQLNKNYS